MANNTHSIEFEASLSQRASIADASQTGLDLSNDMTLEGWVKLESNGAVMRLIHKWDSSAAQEAYRLSISSANKIRADFHDGSSRVGYETNAAQLGTTGIWKYLAMTWKMDTETCLFYVADQSTEPSLIASSQIDGTSIGTTLRNSTSAFIVGSGIDNAVTYADFVDGLMHNWRVWSDVRTLAELKTNYKKILLNTGSDNLVDVFYYRNTHASVSGNNNLTGAPSSPNDPQFVADIPFLDDEGGYYHQSL